MKNVIKKEISNSCVYSLLLASAVYFVGVDAAFAGDDLSATVGEVQTQILTIPNLLSAGCYIGGIIAMVRGVGKLRAHAENPGQNPMGPGLSFLGAGGALVALPSTAGWILSTLSMTGTAPSVQTFTAAATAAS